MAIYWAEPVTAVQPVQFRHTLLKQHCTHQGCPFVASVVDDWRGNGRVLVDLHLAAHIVGAHWRHLVKE